MCELSNHVVTPILSHLLSDFWKLDESHVIQMPRHPANAKNGHHNEEHLDGLGEIKERISGQ